MIKMSTIYNQPIAADMENQVFYLQNMVKIINKKLDEIIMNEGLQGPPGRDGRDGVDGQDGKDGEAGRDGVDGETPDLTDYVRRTEIIRASDGNIRIGTNAINWVKLGRYRFYSDGTTLHISDTNSLKEVQLTLDTSCAPDLEPIET
jgi:hypothetical protein